MAGVAGAFLAAALTALSAQAQPPATQEPGQPEAVCLTNACSPREAAIAKPKTPAEAIKAGNAQAVRDLGGTPGQAMDAIMTRMNARLAATPADQKAMVGEAVSGIVQFADTSDGSTLRFTGNTDFPTSPGQTIVGAVERRAPDGSVQNFWLTDNGGGIWVRPGYEPAPRG